MSKMDTIFKNHILSDEIRMLIDATTNIFYPLDLDTVCRMILENTYLPSNPVSVERILELTDTYGWHNLATKYLWISPQIAERWLRYHYTKDEASKKFANLLMYAKDHVTGMAGDMKMTVLMTGPRSMLNELSKENVCGLDKAINTPVGDILEFVFIHGAVMRRDGPYSKFGVRRSNNCGYDAEPMSDSFSCINTIIQKSRDYYTYIQMAQHDVLMKNYLANPPLIREPPPAEVPPEIHAKHNETVKVNEVAESASDRKLEESESMNDRKFEELESAVDELQQIIAGLNISKQERLAIRRVVLRINLLIVA